MKKLNKYTLYNTRTTLAWRYHHRSLLLPAKGKIWNRNPKNYPFILNTTLTVLLRKRLVVPFNYACIMINVKPNGFLKYWLNSHANNAFWENVLRQHFRSCAHFCKINSVKTQLINCYIRVSDSYRANDFKNLYLFQHLFFIYQQYSTFYEVCIFLSLLPQGKYKNNFRKEYQNIFF